MTSHPKQKKPIERPPSENPQGTHVEAPAKPSVEQAESPSTAISPSAVATSEGKGLKQLEAKWGRDLVAAGWVALPSIILERQDALGLDAIDINIILHIAKHWFEAGSLPHPSKGSIAKAMGITSRAVQKRIATLEALGLLVRQERRGAKGTKGSQTSVFDLSGLIAAATPHAKEALQERARIRQMKDDRLRRKRPRLATEVESEALERASPATLARR